MIIRFLGTHNAESKDTRLVSFLIDDVLAVDAGSLVSELTFSEQSVIRVILLSHSHYDHIRDIPAFAFNNSSCPAKVCGTKETLSVLTSHLIDGVIYPEFASSASYLTKPAIEICALEPYQVKDIEGYRVLPIPVNHHDAVGFEISRDGKSIFYTGDTGQGISAAWPHVSPQVLITDATFPNRLKQAAQDSGHLYPAMLQGELSEFKRLKGYLPAVKLIHLSPRYESEIMEDIGAFPEEMRSRITIASEGDRFTV